MWLLMIFIFHIRTLILNLENLMSQILKFYTQLEDQLLHRKYLTLRLLLRRSKPQLFKVQYPSRSSQLSLLKKLILLMSRFTLEREMLLLTIFTFHILTQILNLESLTNLILRSCMTLEANQLLHLKFSKLQLLQMWSKLRLSKDLSPSKNSQNMKNQKSFISLTNKYMPEIEISLQMIYIFRTLTLILNSENLMNQILRFCMILEASLSPLHKFSKLPSHQNRSMLL